MKKTRKFSQQPPLEPKLPRKNHPLKIAVAGTRTFNDPQKLTEILDEFVNGKDVEFILVGGGRHKINGFHVGADYFAEKWAGSRHFDLRIHHADWQKYGDAAGPMRNREMVLEADEVVVFWDGESKGTYDVIKHATRLEKPLKIVRY